MGTLPLSCMGGTVECSKGTPARPHLVSGRQKEPSRPVPFAARSWGPPSGSIPALGFLL